MINLYIDCEFNGFGGELISMAIIDDAGNEFYEVTSIKGKYDDWVEKNVIPHLNKDAIPYTLFQKKLEYFLRNYSIDGFRLIADWPDDIKYFCEAVITGPGYMMAIPSFRADINRNLSSQKSVIPHNALEDARAIRNSFHGI